MTLVSFAVVVVILALLGLVASKAETRTNLDTSITVVSLSCSDGAAHTLASCALTLAIGEEKLAFQFERAPSLFAEDLTVSQGLNRRLLSEVSEISAPTERFHSTSDPANLATASFAFNGAEGVQLEHAYFATARYGLLEFRDGTFTVSSASHIFKRSLQDTQSNWRGAPMTDPTPFFDASKPGTCYPSDNVPHIARISVATDFGVSQRAAISFGAVGDAAVLAATLESVQSTAALAYLIWTAQLNVRLVITHVEVGSPSSLSPLNGGPSQPSCLTAYSAYNAIQGWLPNRRGDVDWGGVTMFLSTCFNDGVGGLADLGSFCWKSGSAAVVTTSGKDFAHELGHTFWAEHTFQNGMGTTGGIMDYSSGFYNGQIQFHPANKPQLCTFLATMKQRNCAYFQAIATPSQGLCGDMVLAPNEQCECMDGSVSCGQCVRCRLTSPDVECSSLFAIRRPMDRGFVRVVSTLLSSPECCLGGKVPVAQTCNGGEDMCTFGGMCSPVCGSMGYRSCGADTSGCKQRCWVSGTCTADSVWLRSRDVILNALPDNSPCRDPSTAKPGTCLNGACMVDGRPANTSPPSSPPTWAPFPQTVPSRPPTQPPVAQPTKRPTPAKATSAPTAFPSMARLPDQAARCQLIRVRKQCATPCKWCGARGCQAVCPPKARRKKRAAAKSAGLKSAANEDGSLIVAESDEEDDSLIVAESDEEDESLVVTESNEDDVEYEREDEVVPEGPSLKTLRVHDPVSEAILAAKLAAEADEGLVLPGD